MYMHANLNGSFIGEAHVTTSDVMTNNGVIHVIDRVLKPPNGKTSMRSSFEKCTVIASNFCHFHVNKYINYSFSYFFTPVYIISL